MRAHKPNDFTPDRFKQLMADLGWSVTETAKQCAVSARAVRHWLAGERAIPYSAGAILAIFSAEKRLRPAIADADAASEAMKQAMIHGHHAYVRPSDGTVLEVTFDEAPHG